MRRNKRRCVSYSIPKRIAQSGDYSAIEGYWVLDKIRLLYVACCDASTGVQLELSKLLFRVYGCGTSREAITTFLRFVHCVNGNIAEFFFVEFMRFGGRSGQVRSELS